MDRKELTEIDGYEHTEIDQSIDRFELIDTDR